MNYRTVTLQMHFHIGKKQPKNWTYILNKKQTRTSSDRTKAETLFRDRNIPIGIYVFEIATLTRLYYALLGIIRIIMHCKASFKHDYIHLALNLMFNVLFFNVFYQKHICSILCFFMLRCSCLASIRFWYMQFGSMLHSFMKCKFYFSLFLN